MSEKDIKISFPGGQKVQAEFKGFVIKTDQPAYAGGEGSDPAPFDLFLASLATCAGYYVLAFCQERGIPVQEGGGLLMRTSRNREKGLIEKIYIEISLPKEFPEKYLKAVVRAVDSCSVKVHLGKPPLFEVVTKSFGK